MKISTFNANSIRSRLPIIIDWIKKNKPDVLGIQETKVQNVDFPESIFNEMGYHVCFEGEKSYNGVAIISKEKPVEIISGFDDGGPADKTRLICAKFDKFLIINTYIPQGRAIDHIMFKYKLSWYKRLKEFISKYLEDNKSIAWIGDMNIAVNPIDVSNPKTKKNDPCYHVDVREAFLDTCDLGFVDLFRKFNEDKEIYSFFDYRVKDAILRNIGWRIDYILTTDELTKICTNCEIDLDPRKKDKPSDHTFVTATFLD